VGGVHLAATGNSTVMMTLETLSLSLFADVGGSTMNATSSAKALAYLGDQAKVDTGIATLLVEATVNAGVNASGSSFSGSGFAAISSSNVNATIDAQAKAYTVGHNTIDVGNATFRALFTGSGASATSGTWVPSRPPTVSWTCGATDASAVSVFAVQR